MIWSGHENLNKTDHVELCYCYSHSAVTINKANVYIILYNWHAYIRIEKQGMDCCLYANQQQCAFKVSFGLLLMPDVVASSEAHCKGILLYTELKEEVIVNRPQNWRTSSEPFIKCNPAVPSPSQYIMSSTMWHRQWNWPYPAVNESWDPWVWMNWFNLQSQRS